MMKISKESLLYKDVKIGFSVLGFDTFLKVFNDEKQNEKIKNHLISTVWRIYLYISDNNESIKEYRIRNKDIKDNHVETMLFSICKELGYIL